MSQEGEADPSLSGEYAAAAVAVAAVGGGDCWEDSRNADTPSSAATVCNVTCYKRQLSSSGFPWSAWPVRFETVLSKDRSRGQDWSKTGKLEVVPHTLVRILGPVTILGLADRPEP